MNIIALNFRKVLRNSDLGEVLGKKLIITIHGPGRGSWPETGKQGISLPLPSEGVGKGAGDQVLGGGCRAGAPMRCPGACTSTEA